MACRLELLLCTEKCKNRVFIFCSFNNSLQPLHITHTYRTISLPSDCDFCLFYFFFLNVLWFSYPSASFVTNCHTISNVRQLSNDQLCTSVNARATVQSPRCRTCAGNASLCHEMSLNPSHSCHSGCYDIFLISTYRPYLLLYVLYLDIGRAVTHGLCVSGLTGYPREDA